MWGELKELLDKLNPYETIIAPLIFIFLGFFWKTVLKIPRWTVNGYKILRDKYQKRKNFEITLTEYLILHYKIEQGEKLSKWERKAYVKKRESSNESQ